MKVYVLLAVQDQVDTRVDQGAEVKHVIGVLQPILGVVRGAPGYLKPTKKQQQKLLRRWARDNDEDAKDWWVEVEETTCE